MLSKGGYGLAGLARHWLDRLQGFDFEEALQVLKIGGFVFQHGEVSGFGHHNIFNLGIEGGGSLPKLGGNDDVALASNE